METRRVFISQLGDRTHLSFVTEDLHLCQGNPVEIDESAWESVSTVVGTVEVIFLPANLMIRKSSSSHALVMGN